VSSPRLTARVAGILYFVTHVTSVGAVALYGGSAFDPEAALAGRTSVLTGGLLEVILAAAVVGSAAALYPLLRSFDRGLAAAYVALRTLEASVIMAGVVAILPTVARPATTVAAGLDPGVTAGLHLLHDWTFAVGPGLISPINTVVIAWLLWRHRMLPRWIPALGLIGAPLVGVVNIGVLFGITQVIPVAVIPIFAWEISLATYLIVRGLPVRSDV
jgi:predicted aconitase with swiveling domain